MPIKVEGGTIESGRDLCRSCLHGQTIEYVDGSRETNCSVGYEYQIRIRGPVARCSKYHLNEEPRFFADDSWHLRIGENSRLLVVRKPGMTKAERVAVAQGGSAADAWREDLDA